MEYLYNKKYADLVRRYSQNCRWNQLTSVCIPHIGPRDKRPCPGDIKTNADWHRLSLEGNPAIGVCLGCGFTTRVTVDAVVPKVRK